VRERGNKKNGAEREREKLKLTLVSGQLDPEVAFLLVGLEEGRPLDDAAQLSPAGRLKQTRPSAVRPKIHFCDSQ